MSPFLIPIVAIVGTFSMVIVVVIVTQMGKVSKRKMEIEAELQQMEMAYQRARQSLSR